jgi:lipopolysaccharide export system protein LptA
VINARSVAVATLLAIVLATPGFGQGAPMFGGFLATTEDAISIDANTLEWTNVEGRDVLEYRGGVVAVRGAMTIRADVLMVYLPLPDAPGAGAFDRLEASGNVSVVSAGQRATSQALVMDMVAQTVVMNGTVTLNDGANQMAGDRLTVDLTSGGWRLEAAAGDGRVRTTVNTAR